jgi:hypothetical protein
MSHEDLGRKAVGMYHYIGALATAELIGRHKEQSDLQQAVGAAGKDFRLVLLVAGGGTGKTRLLHEVAWQLGANMEHREDASFAQLQQWLNRHPDQAWSRERIICLSMIDLAESVLHTQESFLREVRTRLGEVQHAKDVIQTVFADFDREVTKFEALRERHGAYQDLQRQSTVVLQTFLQDYYELAEMYRIVWLLDTLEQLVGLPPELQDMLEKSGVALSDIGQTTYGWLTSFIANTPPNTTMILAGRPSPGRWLIDVEEQTKQLYGFWKLELRPLDLDEMFTYFDVLSTQLRALGAQIGSNRYVAIADYIDGFKLDPEQPSVLHLLTGGNPVRLALYVDLISSREDLPEVFRLGYEELKHQSDALLDQLREELDGLLLTTIRNDIGQIERDVLLKLFVTRRGLGRKRLAWLIRGTEDEALNLLNQLRQLSFVKARGNKVFLHDEMYTMYERYIARLSEEDRPEELIDARQVQQSIIQYYEERISVSLRAAKELRSKYQRGQALNEEEQYRLDMAKFDQRRYRSEWLHYRLYLDPYRGIYQDYSVLAEQALLGRDFALDSYIQSEMDVFFFGPTAHVSQRLTQIGTDAWIHLLVSVTEERASRWIKRLIQYGKAGAAQEFARQLKNRYLEIIYPYYGERLGRLDTINLSSQELFSLELDAYHSFAAIESGGNIIDAVREVEAVIPHLEDKVIQRFPHPAMQQRILNIIAQCYNYNGYAYAQLVYFHLARDRYEKAKEILDETGHIALRAAVINNLSRMLGELGDLSIALSYCDDGLKLRETLGFESAIGLSLNNKSLIMTLNSRPTPAIEPAKEALRIFQRLGDLRGQVLASLQLAQAQRLSWRLLPEESRSTLLDEAEYNLSNAEAIIAQGQVTEVVRLIIAYLERGALHRERAIRQWQHRTAEEFVHVEFVQNFERARYEFERAYKLASRNEQYLHYVLHANIAEAYLYLRCDDRERAAQIAHETLAVAPEYVFNTQAPLNPTQRMNLAIFTELSKVSALQIELIGDVNQQTFKPLLMHHIFSTTYNQLCSSTLQEEHIYLARSKGYLHALLQANTWDNLNEKYDQVESVIQQYHLAELEREGFFGELQVRRVLARMKQVGSRLPYLHYT